MLLLPMDPDVHAATYLLGVVMACLEERSLSEGLDGPEKGRWMRNVSELEFKPLSFWLLAS